MKSFFDGTEYACKIYKIYAQTAKPGRSCVTNRESYELIYKFSGSSDQFFPDKTLRLLPNQVYFIPLREQYNDVYVDQVGDIINVCFQLYDCPEAASFVPEILTLAPGNGIQNQFEKILYLWQHRENDHMFEVQAAFQSILAAIARERSKVYRTSAAYRRIQPALTLMETEYSRPDITIEDLTTCCGISDEYLRRLFRACIGKTPMEHLRTIRLRQARELLFAGQMCVAEVAHACGFGDARYFTRVFSREYGILPSRVTHGTVG